MGDRVSEETLNKIAEIQSEYTFRSREELMKVVDERIEEIKKNKPKTTRKRKTSTKTTTAKKTTTKKPVARKRKTKKED